jgi:hypothetical protein
MTITKTLVLALAVPFACFAMACGGDAVPEAKTPETPEAPETPSTDTPEAPTDTPAEGAGDAPAEGGGEEGGGDAK